jgi:hypothetical protein
MMRRAGELPRVLAKHLLDGSDPGRQTHLQQFDLLSN